MRMQIAAGAGAASPCSARRIRETFVTQGGSMVWRMVFNSLGILGTAMFAGVMLAIGVILGGHWKSLPAKEFLDAFSANVPFIMRAIPIVLLPAVLGLGGSIWIAWSDRTTRLM